VEVQTFRTTNIIR